MTGTERPIYLDYNATTPQSPEVADAMRPFLDTEFGNPSSDHFYGRRPRTAVSQAREQVAALIGAQPEQIVFTSGGTESNNYAILGTARALRTHGNHIITSCIEHPAVLQTCAALEREGFAVTRLAVDRYGRVSVDEFEAALRPDTILVSIMHANNEIGTVQPIAEITAVAARHGVLVHTDAAQSIGKIPVKVENLGVDMLTVAGHKLYAPKGIGALYLRPGVKPERLMHGGGQEAGVRPGTENMLGIVGLGEASRVADRALDKNARVMKETRDRLYDRLREVCDLRLNGHPVHRLPNTLNVSFAGVRSDSILSGLAGLVSVSAGSACHSGTVTLSPVIEAIGVPMEYAEGTIRFSTGTYTTRDEIDRAAEAVILAVKRL